MEKSLSFRGVEGVRGFNEFGGIAAACHDRRAISFPLFRSVNLVHRRTGTDVDFQNLDNGRLEKMRGVRILQ
jgi:hypothetical protein